MRKLLSREIVFLLSFTTIAVTVILDVIAGDGAEAAGRAAVQQSARYQRQVEDHARRTRADYTIEIQIDERTKLRSVFRSENTNEVILYIDHLRAQVRNKLRKE